MSKYLKFLLLVIAALFTFTSLAVAEQQTPPYPAAFWINGTLGPGPSGLVDLSGFKVVFYNSQDNSYALGYALALTDASGNYRINALADLRLLPLAAATYHIGVVNNGGYGVNEKEIIITADDLTNGYKNMNLILATGEGIPDPETPPRRGGPTLEVTVLLDGYYDTNAGTQRSTSIEVELRNPTTGAIETSVPFYLAYDNNTKAIDGVGENIPDGGSHLIVIKHLNHLSIISSQSFVMSRSQSTIIDFSDAAANNEYQPASPPTTAMILRGTKKAMRGGEYESVSSAGLITVDDWSTWKDAYGSDSITNTARWNPKSDGNGDGRVTVDDWDIWKDNYGSRTYVP